MCNHYRVDNPEDVIGYARAKADALEAEAWAVTADAWPKTAMPVVYQAGQRTLAAMRWGVWPWFEKKPRYVVNARDDKLLSSPAWKKSVGHGRCLVPADGFCEWTGPAGGKREVLFYRPNRRPFFFAGLWSRDPAGEGRGFAIVTGTPNPLVAALPHDRMPVLLDEPAADAWLGDQPLAEERIRQLCAPYAGELIRLDLPPPPRAPVTDELPLA
jgi:putative SOS response-associated peptidase YedK